MLCGNLREPLHIFVVGWEQHYDLSKLQLEDTFQLISYRICMPISNSFLWKTYSLFFSDRLPISPLTYCTYYNIFPITQKINYKELWLVIIGSIIWHIYINLWFHHIALPTTSYSKWCSSLPNQQGRPRPTSLRILDWRREVLFSPGLDHMLMKYHRERPMLICIGIIPNRTSSGAKITTPTDSISSVSSQSTMKKVSHSTTERSKKSYLSFPALKSSKLHWEEP